MEYERIDKVQTGIISPSKLRLKLMGGYRRREGSNNNSSRTSPAKLNDDTQFVKNSLLAAKDGFEEGGSNDFDNAPVLPTLAQDQSVNSSNEGGIESSQGNGASFHQKTKSEKESFGELCNVKTHRSLKGSGGNMSLVHPVRATEEDNLDYDSNASSSSFEFHKGERLVHNPVVRSSFTRPMPSKWNDAEKWIVNRQITQPQYSKKNISLGKTNRQHMASWLRTGPESVGSEPKAISMPIADNKKNNNTYQLSQNALVSPSVAPSLDPSNNTVIDLFPLSRDQKKVPDVELNANGNSQFAEAADCLVNMVSYRYTLDALFRAVGTGIKSVLMRDMGTEMTPVASQEPSRTATPALATTPSRSPTSSVPSTPRQGAPASTPYEAAVDTGSGTRGDGSKKELSEREQQLKTRREIVALGIQLGKMNIAAWASQGEKEMKASAIETDHKEQLDKIEFEKRAAAWEDAEKSKHAARLKREEIKIQAWESNQKAKLEAFLKKVEARAERMRNNAQANMTKKILTIRKQSEEKRTAAETERDQQAAKTASQADYIRRTGQIPRPRFICCGWFS
ncbi:hypothetical protein Sjap_026333 [Stephania japonica]|uniref:Remorin C-terminal domain-containing protein n=1 Tax=Stephania japonica TaxID=461633 RepID=A0AAP0E7S7_9MAGN